MICTREVFELVGMIPYEFRCGDSHVKSRVALEVDDVQAALEAARAEAVKNGWAVSIAVVDDGGHALGFLRLNEAAPLTAQIAFGKARTAALSRRESKFYEDAVKSGRTA